MLFVGLECLVQLQLDVCPVPQTPSLHQAPCLFQVIERQPNRDVLGARRCPVAGQLVVSQLGCGVFDVDDEGAAGPGKARLYGIGRGP